MSRHDGEAITLADPRQNLELKARCPALKAARQSVCRLGAREAGIEIQTDTFFRAPSGRLKLREIEGQPAVLIWYDRPDELSARMSRYYLNPIPDAEKMKATLTVALGVRGVVHKRRAIYLWHNVRIHLDEVRELGTFVEFEAVLGPGDAVLAAETRLNDLCRALRIVPADHLAIAYADLLEL
jgi:predicted adenylyl cyclase CyaB